MFREQPAKLLERKHQADVVDLLVDPGSDVQHRADHVAPAAPGHELRRGLPCGIGTFRREVGLTTALQLVLDECGDVTAGLGLQPLLGSDVSLGHVSSAEDPKFVAPPLHLERHAGFRLRCVLVVRTIPQLAQRKELGPEGVEIRPVFDGHRDVRRGHVPRHHDQKAPFFEPAQVFADRGLAREQEHRPLEN